MKLKDLTPNIRNPRKISAAKKEALKRSVLELGDLGGIIENIRTKRLVGGHQRSSVLPPDSKITITQKYDAPTKAGTLAEGYVEVEGERYSFRRVDWDEEREVTALLAANKHQGEWDEDLLRVTLADFPKLDMHLAGFKLPTIEIAPLPPAPVQTDEQYVASTPQTTEQIPVENIGGSAFEKVKESTEVPGRRIVIIIDCPTEEVKKSLRESLRAEVEKNGAQFF